MSANNLKSLDRFFRAKSVVFIGGKDLFTPINEIKRRGFVGKIFVVNPKRKNILDFSCYQSVSELPESPDAAFIAVPAKNVILTIKDLKSLNCGGVVCYSSGFKEIGKHGGSLEQQLIDSCGDMPLIGPNCYGFINYINNLALWSFAHDGFSPGFGAAIITQSGMLSSDILMTQRSLPLSHMVSIGNQAVTTIEDLINYFCLQDTVKAIGIHIEGIKDIRKFMSACNKALSLNKPIIVLRTGKSRIGKNLTRSHTGSLSGDNEVFSAFFDQLGIIEVNDPIQFIESLKFFSLSKPISENKLIAFTCSGGGATILADVAERLALRFQPFKKKTKELLKKHLPPIATVSNPLDYTTPIWGIHEKTSRVFRSAMNSYGYSLAILIQDFPLSGLDESIGSYLNDTDSFITEAKKLNIIPIICSTFPENINKTVREKIISLGAIPMQGIDQCLNTVASSLEFSKKKQPGNRLRNVFNLIEQSKEINLNELEGKSFLQEKGVSVPKNEKIEIDSLEKNILLNFPISLKYTSPSILHKTELGAVKLNISDKTELNEELGIMGANITEKVLIRDGIFFIEEMESQPIAEMFLSLRNDKQFGKILVLGMGGSLTELLKDTCTFILPISKNQLYYGLSKLKVYKQIKGFRNKGKVNKNIFLKEVFKIIDIFQEPTNKCSNIEINPLFIYEKKVLVVDCVLSLNK